MHKSILLLTFTLTCMASTAFAQTVIIGPPIHGPRARPRQHLRANMPAFTPSVSISAGYGFPAVDTKYLPEFYGVGKGDASQHGVFAASVDYQFSRRMSIGVMVTHASFSAPYYGYFSTTDLPDLTAHFDNRAFLITLVRYIPVSRRSSLYIRTAIGGNSWKQDYEDINGNKVTVTSVDLPALAHQLALGMKVRLTPHMGLSLEGGYGKYIVRGGLSLRL